MSPRWRSSLARALQTGPAFTLRHAAILTLACVGLTAPLAALAAVPPRGPSQARQPAPRPTVSVSAPAQHGFPALDAIQAVVGRSARWGRGVPLPLDCDQPPLVASATASSTDGRTIGAFVTPTGAGAEAFQRIRQCASSRAGVNGRPFAVVDLDGGNTVIWQRGDMLMSVTAARFDPVTLAAIDRRAVRALRVNGCIDLDPTVADARRSPDRPDYAPHTIARTVRIDPVNVHVGGEDALTRLLDVRQVRVPDGVAGPPLPEPVDRPEVPQYPGVQQASISTDVPAADPVGPGCGWAFTDSVGPVDDRQAIEQAADALVELTQRDLRAQQKQWLQRVARYEQRRAPYERAAQAWNAYARRVAAVQKSWAHQRAELDRYDEQLTRWRSERDALSRFRAERDAASAQFEADTRACTAGRPRPSGTASASPTPEPTTTPSGSSGAPTPVHTPACPPARPAILDQREPAVEPQPVMPHLWRPSDGGGH